MPPPALASTTSSLSCSCACSISFCICCACFISAFTSKPPGIHRLVPPNRPPPRRTRSSASPPAPRDRRPPRPARLGAGILAVEQDVDGAQARCRHGLERRRELLALVGRLRLALVEGRARPESRSAGRRSSIATGRAPSKVAASAGAVCLRLSSTAGQIRSTSSRPNSATAPSGASAASASAPALGGGSSSARSSTSVAWASVSPAAWDSAGRVSVGVVLGGRWLPRVASESGGRGQLRPQRPPLRRQDPRPTSADAFLESLDPPQQPLGRRVEVRARRFQQRDLDRHARVVSLAHRGQRRRQLVDRADQRRRADRRRLGGEAALRRWR